MSRSPAGRLLRGYGPLAALVLVFTLMAAFVPTVGERVRTVTETASGAEPPVGDGATALLPPDGGGPPVQDLSPGESGAATTAPGRAATATSGSAPGAGRQATPSTARAGGPGTPTAAPAATAPARGRQPAGPVGSRAGVGPCPDRAKQIPSDPYSPSCVTFSGDNGGATSRGVTADKVIVSARLFELPDFAKDMEAAKAFTMEPAELEQTMRGLADYFNSRFQLYGRQMEFVFHKGRGDIVAEFQGGGQEGAEADAVKTAEEIKPFAATLAITTPFADALARRKVLNIGAMYMSREWYDARRPYTWSSNADCTFVLESLSDYLLKRVVKRPAFHAGGDLKDEPRTLAVIVPEQPYYQECAAVGERRLREAGAPPALTIAYKMDINSLSNQAASIAAKLRNERITTVLCACDPILPVFLTSKAHEQAYEPEWIVSGVAWSDSDTLGQAYQQDQWSRAFGLSFTAARQPVRATYGYHAFKAARPNEEPIELVDELYYHLYVLALGIQMAGPNLTPETFEAGLRSYPAASGPAGTFQFSPGRYTPTQDAREIFWDPEAVSPVNGNPGAYVETEPGRRYRPGDWPPGDPPVFGSARPQAG